MNTTNTNSQENNKRGRGRPAGTPAYANVKLNDIVEFMKNNPNGDVPVSRTWAVNNNLPRKDIVNTPKKSVVNTTTSTNPTQAVQSPASQGVVVVTVEELTPQASQDQVSPVNSGVEPVVLA
jgi:hypothetical protein